MSRKLRGVEDLCAALATPFSDEQLSAITAPLEPSVIIAGAGTGKTTTMAARVVWLVGTGQVRPDEVLGLTFTRKAAAELSSRVSAALVAAGVVEGTQDEGAEVILTYDSFAGKLVEEFGLRLGLEQGFTMLTGAARYRLASRAVTAAPGPFTGISRLSPVSIPERVLDLDAQLQSHLVPPDEVEHFTLVAREKLLQAPRWRGQPYKDVALALAALDERLELLRLVADYQHLKTERGFVEFADQLRRAVELVERVPAVAQRIRDRFAVVLLDEYQDTSSAQAVLLQRLFSGPTAEAGRGFPVTAVGDPQQAIYGWRGAAASNILEFPEAFRAVDGTSARRYTLSVNRRSGQRILDVGNCLAREVRHGGAAAGVELVAPLGTPPGRVQALSFDSQTDELEWLATRVTELHDAGRSWAEMAVLVRRNATLADVHALLRERDVPTEIVGLGGLIHLPEVAPVVAMLRLLDDVAANPATAGLLTGPRWRLGLADLEALGRRARELSGEGGATSPASETPDVLDQLLQRADATDVASLLDAVADPGGSGLTAAGRERVAEFHDTVTRLREHVGESIPDLVRRVIHALALEVEAHVSDLDDGAQLARFVDAASTYVDVDGDGSLTGFLAYLDAEDRHGEGLERAVPSDADSVKLLTVHRAKGLEWHTVFLPAWAEGVFPAQYRTGIWPLKAQLLPAPLRGDAASIPQLRDYTKQGIADYLEDVRTDHELSEDRLAYVAATRARQELYVSTHTWVPGLVRPRGPSRFYRATEEVCADSCHAATSSTNPSPPLEVSVEWPIRGDEEAVHRRRQAARLVHEAAALEPDERPEWETGSGVASPGDLARIQGWDRDLAILNAQRELRRQRDVVLPEGLSASALMALAADAQGFVTDLVRPMPRRPRRSARIGTLFHDWVQHRHDRQAGFEELDSHGPGADDPELVRLVDAFETGRFGQLDPVAVEVPFLLHWDNHVLRGRIDAVYRWREPHSFLVVDWKTSDAPANPLQLAVYRQAWSRAMGIPDSKIATAFYHVLSDDLRFVDARPGLISGAFSGLQE